MTDTPLSSRAATSLDAPEHILMKWLRDNWSPDMTLASWWALLGDAGWSAPTWPEEHGGRGLDAEAGGKVVETIEAFGAVPGPGSAGIYLAAPTLFAHGSDEQIRRYVDDIRAGRSAWCQLFSEPDAGSDLSSAKTKAERDGDVWRITGEKVWTSGAETAEYAILLARSDPDAEKHAGLSYFIIDMRQPGVTVLPLREMTGRSLFNQVFLDEAIVPAADLVGSPGQGWEIAKTTLSCERALAGVRGFKVQARPGSLAGHLHKPAGTFASIPLVEEADTDRTFSDLLQAASDTERRDDPIVRDQLASLYILRWVNSTTATRLQQAPPTPVRAIAASLAKMADNREQRLRRDVSLSLLGPAGTLHAYDASRDATTPGDALAHQLVDAALYAQGPQIFGGTDQIQHNMVGERGLGLPREPTSR